MSQITAAAQLDVADHAEHQNNPRCLVVFWGVGGAGSRLTQRVGGELSARFLPDKLALSLHRGNSWLEQAKGVCSDIDVIDGRAGHTSGLSIVLGLPRQLWRFARHLRRFSPDIVVVPMNFAQACLLGIVARLFGHKLIYVVHDAQPHPGDYAQRFQILSQRSLIGTASRIVTMSSVVGEALRTGPQSIRRDKISIVPLAALVPRLRSAPRMLDDRPIRFLFLGRLLKYKGLDILAKALSAIQSRDDWTLTIAGNGSERDFVLAAFSQFRQVDLSQLETISEEAVDALLDSHDVVLCPYVEASQSGVIAEGFGHGLPALVTPVGALPEQVGDGVAGWIARAPTSDALAACLLDVLENRAGYAAKSAMALQLASAGVGSSAWADIVRSTLQSTPGAR